jgi:hypothetical protein
VPTACCQAAKAYQNANAQPYSGSLAISGICLGTSSVTNRGFGKDEMVTLAAINHEVAALCVYFPVPGIDSLLRALPPPALMTCRSSTGSQPWN